jgi:hypothetical protein
MEVSIGLPSIALNGPGSPPPSAPEKYGNKKMGY